MSAIDLISLFQNSPLLQYLEEIPSLHRSESVPLQGSDTLPFQGFQLEQRWQWFTVVAAALRLGLSAVTILALALALRSIVRCLRLTARSSLCLRLKAILWDLSARAAAVVALHIDGTGLQNQTENKKVSLSLSLSHSNWSVFITCATAESTNMAMARKKQTPCIVVNSMLNS